MRYRKLSDLQRDIETLEGTWELSSAHELIFRERRGKDKEAQFKTSLVAAEPNALVVSVTVQEDVPDPNDPSTASARAGRSRPIRKRTVTGLVKLTGKWELDEKNRITFSIKRGLGKYDKLTFQGAWEINDNFQVTYTFETKQVLGGSKKKRKRVTKVSQELVFEGHWDISGKNCLTYLIGVDSDSAFRFRGTFEGATQPQWSGTASARAGRSRPIRSILAKKGEIRYQVGVEYKTSRGAKKQLRQTITLFGKWKLSDDLALSFELECADGKRSEIRVGTEFSLKKLQERLPLLPDEVTVDLTSKEGDPLGVEVVLTKDLFDGNARTFVRFRESLKETALEAGITIPW